MDREAGKEEIMDTHVFMLTWNNKEETIKAIESIHNTLPPRARFTVLDNNSKDGLQDYLKTLTWANVVLDKEHCNQIPAKNRCLKMFPSEYYVFTQPDAIYPRGWLETLIECAESNPKIGMVSLPCHASEVEPLLIDNKNSTNVIFVQRVFKDGSQRIEQIDISRNKIIEADFVASVCTLLADNCLKDIGYLDESYGRGWFDDIEYSFRARKQGWKIVINCNMFLEHRGRGSFSNLDMRAYEKWAGINISRFLEKYKDMCRTPPELGMFYK